MQAKKEQRRYIRVQDRIYLKTVMISKERHDELIRYFEDGLEPVWCNDEFSVTAQSRFRDSLRKIMERDSALANALEVIDNKLNMIINKLEERDDAAGYRLCDVNISAAGLNVAMKEDVSTGQHFDLSIRLLPEQFVFRALGKAVRVEKGADGLNSVGIGFTWITDSDREILIEHIFNIQVVQLRIRREKKEQEET
jgi:hypothetical protein